MHIGSVDKPMGFCFSVFFFVVVGGARMLVLLLVCSYRHAKHRSDQIFSSFVAVGSARQLCLRL